MMRGNRSILFAALLIGVGVVLLLQQTGAISEDVSVWPIILIGVGVLLFAERVVWGSRSGGGFVVPLVLVAIGLAFLLEDLGAIEEDGVLLPLVVIAVGTGLIFAAIPGRRAPGARQATVPLDGASRGAVTINHGAGHLRVRSHIGGSNLLEGTFGGGVDVRQRRDGDRVDVTLSANPGRMGFGWRPGALDWEMTLARNVPLALHLKTGANDAEVDLSDLDVEDVRLDTGASRTVLTLPSTGRVSARISGGAAEIRIVVPSRMAARIDARGGLSSIQVDPHRFPREGEVYRSPDYDESSHRADITIDTGAAKVEVG